VLGNESEAEGLMEHIGAERFQRSTPPLIPIANLLRFDTLRREVTPTETVCVSTGKHREGPSVDRRVGKSENPRSLGHENSDHDWRNTLSQSGTGPPGDFNHDGTVDAADYVVWRNGLGTMFYQNAYGVWRAHFGIPLGPDSGSAGYPLGASAESLSAAVPEPVTVVLLAMAGMCVKRRRTRAFVPKLISA
jgi:hypothetical protein